MKHAIRRVADQAHGAASEATAATATPFLAQSGERQTDELPKQK